MIKNPLPVRSGINASRLYVPKGDWKTLFSFLVERFPHLSPEVIQMRLIKGDMVNEQGIAYQLDSPCPKDSWLWYYREVEKETPVPFDLNILFQDDYLIAVDKPHFLASTPGGRYLHETALIRLRKMLNNYHLSPLHRLDRDTAGVLLFCVNPSHRGIYQQLFQRKDIHKIYECIAPWDKSLNFPLSRRSHIEKSKNYFTMQENNDPTLTPNSETYIELIQHNQQWGYYRLTPYTGKKHQLRVHMNGLHIPICYDEFYPELLPARSANNFEFPLQLLAKSIRFIDPITQQERFFESKQTLALAEKFFL